MKYAVLNSRRGVETSVGSSFDILRFLKGVDVGEGTLNMLSHIFTVDNRISPWILNSHRRNVAYVAEQ